MRKITDSLSKEVVSVSEGEIIGMVTNAYVDDKLSRIRGYKISREESDEPSALPFRRVLGEEDAITIRYSASLRDPFLKEAPLGIKVYDSMGKYLGILRDLLHDTAGQVHSLLIDDKEISPKEVVRFGSSALLLRAPIHAGKVFRHRKHAPTTESKRKKKLAPIQDIPLEETLLPEVTTEHPTAQISVIEEPDLIFGQDYTFLLGRIVLRTIGSEKDPIAKAEDRVTPAILRKARERGKLVELTVNSKKA